MDLIQELMNGTVEYRDNGVEIRHPPSAAMVRAARILQQIDAQNTINMQLLMKVQQENQELLQQLATLQEKLNERAAVEQPTNDNESIRKTEEPVSSVERSNG